MIASSRTRVTACRRFEIPQRRICALAGTRNRTKPVAIAIDVDDEDRAARIFAKLAQDGSIVMPFEETFFARKFGMAADKFGVRWMVSVAPIALVRA